MYKHTTIEPDPFTYNLHHLSGKQGERLRGVLEKIAAAYEDDIGVSDLSDLQPAHSVTDLTLGEVRLARSLLR